MQTWELLSEPSTRLQVDAPCSSLCKVHDQWPLILLGSPLATLISVNSLDAVSALLSMGADPLARIYRDGQFPADDVRSGWTPLHVASKYHCSDIFLELSSHIPPEKWAENHAKISPLACALSFSTSVDRFAICMAEATSKNSTRRLLP